MLYCRGGRTCALPARDWAPGERLARQHLVRQGYEILETNIRLAGLGEIDIVARDGDTLAFVEVRTRRGQGYGSPEDSLTDAKQVRLAALAEAWLEVRQQESPALAGGPGGRAAQPAAARVERLEIVKDVVEDLA